MLASPVSGLSGVADNSITATQQHAAQAAHCASVAGGSEGGLAPLVSLINHRCPMGIMASKTLYSTGGRLGITVGMDDTTEDTVQEQDSGSWGGNRNYIVDLSQLMSQQLGKQMSMMATYRVKGFSMSLRNKEDTVLTDSNDYGLQIGGKIDYFAPTKHRVDALQEARQYLRDGAGSGSEDLDWSPFGAFGDKTYKGLRFNWGADSDGVAAPTMDGTTVLDGDEFALDEILDHYNSAIGGTPTEEGYGHGGTGIYAGGNAVWDTRTAVNHPESIYWNTYYRNSGFNDGITNAFHFEPESGPWLFMTPGDTHLPVLGGLLRVSPQHTNTDNPRLGDIEDDYYLQMNIFIEGWEGF